MHVFIAGVMQGSRLDREIGEQDYRVRIANVLREINPDVHISDPWALNQVVFITTPIRRVGHL